MDCASLWKVDATEATSEADLGLEAVHNNALSYDVIILSGTVKRSRRRDGGVGGSISRAQR
jgi:hypothetical protein